MTDIAVCIPWRPQPHRLAAFRYVTQWWDRNGFRVVLGDTTHATFNLAGARNRAVAKAKADIVIVADADTIPDLDAVRAALRRLSPGKVIYPFNDYRYVSAEPAPDLVLADAPVRQQYRGSVGGLLVTTSDHYWAIGGHDEHFERWGYEDNAFHLAAQTLGVVERLAGTVYAFAHDADRDMTRQNPGRSRIELYRFAATKPAIMRELVKR